MTLFSLKHDVDEITLRHRSLNVFPMFYYCFVKENLHTGRFKMIQYDAICCYFVSDPDMLIPEYK